MRKTFYDVNYIYSTVVKVLNDLSDLEIEAEVDYPQSFEVGSMVEIPMAEGSPRYGVIRWIGTLPTLRDRVVAGLELVKTAVSCLAPLIILLFAQKFSPLLIRLNPLCVARLHRPNWKRITSLSNNKIMMSECHQLPIVLL